MHTTHREADVALMRKIETAAAHNLRDYVTAYGVADTALEATCIDAQAALIEARLRAHPAGRTVMAEVAPGSGSERNYLRGGFRIAYARTHYVRTVS